MTNVVAMDISKTSCGVAIGDASGPPRTVRVPFTQRDRGEVYAAFQLWLRDLIVLEQPGLVACEAAFFKLDAQSSAETTRILLGLAACAESICAARKVRHVDVPVMTWRKAFLGNGRPKDPKGDALRMCALLGWPTDGNHDRAEACGVWSFAHMNHGNAKAMHRLLSRASVRNMEAR